MLMMIYLYKFIQMIRMPVKSRESLMVKQNEGMYCKRNLTLKLFLDIMQKQKMSLISLWTRGNGMIYFRQIKSRLEISLTFHVAPFMREDKELCICSCSQVLVGLIVLMSM